MAIEKNNPPTTIREVVSSAADHDLLIEVNTNFRSDATSIFAENAYL